ncbi:MAG: hypothetical protein JSU73_00350 [candidate division WOR-3 bacterium]|nr:MAG: hypothetical protein JSU73_00350 [candidate division WOR-3 bacterium]
MKGTRKSGWALCLAALAAVLSVPLRADTAETNKKPLVVPFDEVEMERYRMDVHPAKLDSGILAGLVIAYGHPITPPYAVTAESGRVYVNEVQILPPLMTPEMLRQQRVRAESLASRSPAQLKVEKEQEELIASSQAVYDSVSAAGDSAGATQAAVEFIRRSLLVDSVSISGEGCWVHWTGRLEPLAMAFKWPKDTFHQPAPELSRTKEEVAANVARTLRGDLAAGRVMAVAHGTWYASTSRPALLRAWMILEDNGKTPEEKLWLLAPLVPCPDWLVANFRPEEWMSALGGER